jgi:hypothetical protein
LLPNFLIIGAPRAGTTWIDKNLRDHPDVHMAATKEVHFFDRHYERGIEFYESQFRHWNGQAAVGEATPAYLHGQFTANDIPRLIHRHLPQVRLIASLRDPVERVYSEYWNVKAKDRSNARLSFEDKIAMRPEFLREGLYHEQLQRYLELFPRERMLILFYEDLAADADAFMRGIHRFLGVDPAFRSSFADVKVNRATGKKYLARSRLLWLGTQALTRLRLHGAAEILQRINAPRVPPIRPETRRRLVEFYRPHNERLAVLTGRNLDHWNRVDERVADTQVRLAGAANA